MNADYAARFRRSSYCNTAGNCVEVAVFDRRIGVRDSKAGAQGHVLTFAPDEWAAFVAGVKAGEFD